MNCYTIETNQDGQRETFWLYADNILEAVELARAGRRGVSCIARQSVYKEWI